jgi:hypothetical protein
VAAGCVDQIVRAKWVCGHAGHQARPVGTASVLGKRLF